MQKYPKKKVLYLQGSNVFDKNLIFSEIAHDYVALEIETVLESKSKPELDGKWDVVFGDFPFGYRTKSKWSDLALDGISYSLKLISNHGVGVFLLVGYTWAFERNNLRKLVEEKNCYVNSVINLPLNFMRPMSAVRPILVFVSNHKTEYEYVVEFDEIEPQKDRMRSVLQAVVSHLGSSSLQVVGNSSQKDSASDLQIQNLLQKQENYIGNLNQGICVSPRQIKGFEDWKIRKSISKLSTDYAQYKVVSLEKITTDMKITRGEFEDSENAVYIPLIGKQNCQTELSNLKLKHQNLCQVIVNQESVLPHYLMCYLNSDLGHKILDLKRIEYGSLIPRLTKKQIGEIEVALPSIPIQSEIVETANKLDAVLTTIESVQANLSLNPHSSENELKKLERIVSAIGELSAADEIRSLARNDESKQLEFKETLCWNVRTKQKDKRLEQAVIKTVAAFLNSDGGDLLIGVDDSGQIKGLNLEINKLHRDSNDRLKLHLNNLLRDSIGPEFSPFCESKIVEVGDCIVLRISCKPSDQEVFVDNRFYIRTDPATLLLEGRPFLKYVSTRFTK